MTVILGNGEGKKRNVLGLEFTAKAGGSDTSQAYDFNEVD